MSVPWVNEAAACFSPGFVKGSSGEQSALNLHNKSLYMADLGRIKLQYTRLKYTTKYPKCSKISNVVLKQTESTSETHV